jgi:anti-sigma factor ChrR (cupin superfamily)
LNTHEQYEELCALASSGQASADELNDLRSHLEGCPSCRSTAYDFTQISAQGLSQVAAKRLRCEIPSGMTQRFVARARTEGIEISRENVAPMAKPRRIGVFASVCAVAAVVVLGAFLVIARQKSSSIAAGPRPGTPPLAGPPSGDASRQSQNQDLEIQRKLASAEADIASMEAANRKQRGELESLGEAKDSLASRLSSKEQENATIRSEKAQLEAKIAGLEADVERSKSDKNTSDAVVALEENELRNLRNTLATQEATIGQQEELAARGSDVRDLVVARNLHIIDVHDRDGDGKNQRAFGRIFYTEGKSLIFYAYDLADPRKVDAKVSFCVWGERLGAEKPISSLGVFHSDDAKDGRWVLTFDDPNVLAQINSVFVTVESSRKAVKEPGGKRILFAFLGDKPNHP